MPRLQAACCAQSGGGTAPAAFALEPDFSRLAILKPAMPAPPQLDLRSLTFKAPRAAMSRISLASPRELLADQRFCNASDACSPDGTWLLSALPAQPLSLQCWNVPEIRWAASPCHAARPF